jgi:hypothetical protein
MNKTVSDNGVVEDVPQCADMTASAADKGSDVETPQFQGEQQEQKDDQPMFTRGQKDKLAARD